MIQKALRLAPKRFASFKKSIITYTDRHILDIFMDKELTFRLATKDDLLDIVMMLADDNLGATREKFSDILSDNYIKAFDIINSDHNQELTIVEMNGVKVATFHLTFIQYLTHQGGLRAQIEAVRTNSNFRGQGIGKKVLKCILFLLLY